MFRCLTVSDNDKIKRSRIGGENKFSFSTLLSGCTAARKTKETKKKSHLNEYNFFARIFIKIWRMLFFFVRFIPIKIYENGRYFIFVFYSCNGKTTSGNLFFNTMKNCGWSRIIADRCQIVKSTRFSQFLNIEIFSSCNVGSSTKSFGIHNGRKKRHCLSMSKFWKKKYGVTASR